MTSEVEVLPEAALSDRSLDERLPANGVDAMTGDYSVPLLSASEVAEIARGEEPDPVHALEASLYAARLRAGSRELIDDRSEAQLDEAGWGVIFAQGADPEIREALAELLDLRRDQANQNETLYREFRDETAYRRGQTKLDFLDEHGSGPGEVDPRIVPYYLLLVGSPEEIPFDFQYQLDMQHAVGRIWFETPEEYRSYARSVVAAESERPPARRPRDLALFGPSNPEDLFTHKTSPILVESFAQSLAPQQQDGWRVRKYQGPEATKQRLASLLGGGERPDLLLTATHGLCLPAEPRERQRALQGALICQEWPGPSWKGPLSPDWYFAANDVAGAADLQGMITLHFACYSGGTPQLDGFDWRPVGKRRVLAAEPFVAALPRRLMGHPGGGALAVAAHVDLVWHHSIWWRQRPWPRTLETVVRRLLKGERVGRAFEPLNLRYAELTTDLSNHRQQEKDGPLSGRDDGALADLWVALNDTRGFVVLGDPAVRLPATEAEAGS